MKKKTETKSERTRRGVMEALIGSDMPEEVLSAIVRDVKKFRLYSDHDVMQRLESKSDEEAVRSLIDDASVFVALEQAFSRRIDVIREAFESKADELYHTMLAYEQALRMQLGFPGYEHFTTDFQVEFLDGAHYKNPFDESASIDHFVSYFSITLKFFLEANERARVNFDDEKYKAACEHIPLSGEWAIFHEQRSIWEHGGTFGRHAGTASVFDASQSPQLSAFRISLSRLRAVRQAEFLKKMSDPRVERSCRKLPIKGFRSNDEVRSAYMTTQQFYSSDLEEVVHGARLCEWIRAYTLIKEMSAKHINSHPIVGHPGTLLLHTSAADVVQTLIEGGVVDATAKEIVHHLTFTRHSKDILDAPLIPFDGRIVLIPTVAMLIEPAFSLESLLKSLPNKTTAKADDRKVPNPLQYIGPNFEQLTRRILADAGIVARKVERRDKDCDVAFVLEGDVLFLCECKGKFQVSDYRSYLDLEEFLVETADEQHRKTCEYFERNLHYIRNKLDLPTDWLPSRVIRVVLTSAKLGREQLHDDFFVIDENMFYAFFSRTRVSMEDIRSGRRSFIPDPRLEGEITVDAFIDYMNHPPAILRTRALQEVRELQLALTDRTVTFRDVECYGEVLTERKMSPVWTPSPIV